MSVKRDEPSPKSARQVRLETQLRENLKKRKEQTRARRRQDEPADDDAIAAEVDAESRRQDSPGASK